MGDHYSTAPRKAYGFADPKRIRSAEPAVRMAGELLDRRATLRPRPEPRTGRPAGPVLPTCPRRPADPRIGLLPGGWNVSACEARRPARNRRHRGAGLQR